MAEEAKGLNNLGTPENNKKRKKKWINNTPNKINKTNNTDKTDTIQRINQLNTEEISTPLLRERLRKLGKDTNTDKYKYKFK